ncbi:hypothetical protein Ocin01_09656 [Orchesella cincta]|uniref:CUB domain-containing protein n=1 Tax=Orchesella cincta TaxID=48709 RepID=A0A1D2MVD8_ORCCI|nr:hypothetical protein Ocin01_09656 [Orchesella cincta]
MRIKKQWNGGGSSLSFGLLVLYCVIESSMCYKINKRASSSKTALDNFQENELDRSSRLFPLFSIVRISNQPCVPDAENSVGTCFTNNQCRNAGGVVSGVCASGFGVCCVVTATCESVVTQNNTNIRNRDFPNAFTPGGLEVCNVRLQKPNPNVCQLRLDFIQLQLATADPTNGQCMADRLSINGVSGTAPPNLCGDLSGQHMYLDYGSSDRITLSVITDGAAIPMSRLWNVRATFIECNSLLRAPDGCLQYFTTATAQVKMMGYPMTPHLADLDYTVCVRSEDGAGAIVWSPCQGEPINQAFLMSGDAPADGAMGTIGPMCDKDYVLIMTESEVPAGGGTAKMDDRYCGSAFATDTAPHMVRSIAKPFIMRVKTDEVEEGDMMNSGFCLAYRQEPPRPTG